MPNNHPEHQLIKASLGTILVCLILSGCGHLKTKQTTHSSTLYNMDSSINDEVQQSAARRQQTLAELENWQVAAKVTVQRQGKHYSTAFFNWRQSGRDYQIDITSPFGNDHLLIEQNGEQTTAVTQDAEGKSKRYKVQDLEVFIQKLTGLELPIKQLKFWIKGIADPDQPSSLASYDTDNNLISLTQQNWKIDWSRFQQTELNHQSVNLPYKIQAQQKSDGTLKVNMIIAEWKTSK